MTTILEKVQTADNLPTLPAVAIKILDLIQAEDISVTQIANVIQQDPALTARLLKLVNSSMFGVSRKVSTVQQAVLTLGLRTVKVMVLGFSLVDAMNEVKRKGFDHCGYWRRSLTTSVVSRLLANKINPDVADQAFVSGLLCDIGMLAAFHCAEDLYSQVLTQYNTCPTSIQAAEKSILGITHETISSDLLGHWGLPSEILKASASHHHPIDEPIVSDNVTLVQLTIILRAAVAIAELFSTDDTANQLDDVKRLVRAELPISEADLHEVFEAIDHHVRETATMFSLNIGPTRSYRDIQTKAVLHLAQLTISAELERAQLAEREKATRLKMQQLHDENRELAQQATTDGLTGIANRAAFEQQLANLCNQAQREQRELGMILLDIDRFKKLNDTFGHRVGDEALRRIGALLNRLEDDRKFAARYGGEEFAIIMAQATANEIRDLAEQVRQDIRQINIPFQQKNIRLTASFGAVVIGFNHQEFHPHNLVQLADECLYEAKNEGRNRVVFYDPQRAGLRHAARTHPL